jgi:bacterioferritin-associated ferredoxin
MIVCLCAGVAKATIVEVIEGGAGCLEDLTGACGAGGDCGACTDVLVDLLGHHGHPVALDAAG